MLSNAYSKSANYKLWTSKYSEPDLGHSRCFLHKPCPHLYVFFYLYIKTCNVTYYACSYFLSFMQVVLPINLGFSWSWSHPGPDDPGLVGSGCVWAILHCSVQPATTYENTCSVTWTILSSCHTHAIAAWHPRWVLLKVKEDNVWNNR